MRLYTKILLILIFLIIIPSIVLIQGIIINSELKGEKILEEELLKNSKEALSFLENMKDEYYVKAKEMIDSNKIEKLENEFDKMEIVTGFEGLNEEESSKIKSGVSITQVSFKDNYIEFSFKHLINKSEKKYIKVEKKFFEKDYMPSVFSQNNAKFAVVDVKDENKILIGNFYNSYGEKQKRGFLTKDKINKIIYDRVNVYEKSVTVGQKIYKFIYFPIIDNDRVAAIGVVGIDKSEIQMIIDMLKKNIFLVMLISIILASLSTLLISSIIVVPVEKIENYTKKVAEGNLEEILFLKNHDELGNLAKNIQIMVTTLRDNINKERELEKKIYETEIRKEYIDEIEKKNKEIMKAMVDLTAAQETLLAREKFASLGEMAGGIAHELNNPLGAILNSVQLIKSDIENIDFEEKKETQESIQIIESATKKGKTIVSSLLNYSRRKAKEFTSVDISEVMKETLLLIKHRLNGIELIKEYDDKMPFIINGNIEGMIQVFTNLITNAIDAMEMADSEKKEIKIKIEKKDDKIVVSVKDTGPGIPDGIRAKIFDPFFTTKPIGKGTGLGLSIVMGIVKEHGGEINLNTPKNDGTEFIITFMQQN